jgi:hypothetical protein
MGVAPERLQNRDVEWSASPLDPFFNPSTVDAIDKAERLATFDR